MKQQQVWFGKVRMDRGDCVEIGWFWRWYEDKNNPSDWSGPFTTKQEAQEWGNEMIASFE